MQTEKESPFQGKLLVLASGVCESEDLLCFSAKRAHRTGNRLLLLRVVPRPEAQYWLNIKAILQQEAVEDAYRVLEQLSALARRHADVEIDLAVREGEPMEEMLSLSREDQSIVNLILSAGKTGVGDPAVLSAISGMNLTQLRVPITIVPEGVSPGSMELLA